MPKEYVIKIRMTSVVWNWSRRSGDILRHLNVITSFLVLYTKENCKMQDTCNICLQCILLHFNTQNTKRTFTSEAPNYDSFSPECNTSILPRKHSPCQCYVVPSRRKHPIWLWAHRFTGALAEPCEAFRTFITLISKFTTQHKVKLTYSCKYYGYFFFQKKAINYKF